MAKRNHKKKMIELSEKEEATVIYHAGGLANHVSMVRGRCDGLINFMRDSGLSSAFEGYFVDFIRWEGEMGGMEQVLRELEKIKIMAETEEVMAFPGLREMVQKEKTK